MYFDLIIIGSGPGGYVAAIRAAQLGLKTAIVEKENLGGVCLNWGCIPTKSLLKSVTIFNSLKKASKYGIITNNLKLDLKKIILRSRNISDSMNKGVLFLMKKNNIKILYGEAKICKKKIVSVIDKYGNKKKYNALNIIIATGAKYKIFNTVKKNKLSTIIGHQTIREAIDQINADLENISKWSVINGLKLNSSKCTVLHTAPQDLVETLISSGVSVSLDGGSLAICDSVKTLGVVLDKNLTFSDHITQASQRALGRLRGLYRFRDLLPESAKIQIVRALILSVVHYCFPAYGNSITRGDMDRLQRLQNSAIRFVFCLKRSEHVSPFREAANLLSMEAVCRMLTCCMIHRTLTLREPEYLCQRLSFRDEVAHRSTRHGGRLHFPKVNLEFGRRSFSYFAPKLYNELPDAIKEVSLVSFKTKLRCLLIESN